jgi:hypothetical protein
MFRFRESAWTRAWLSLSLLATLLWGTPQLQAAVTVPIGASPDPYQDPDAADGVSTLQSPSGRCGSSPGRAGFDELPAGVRTTVVFTIHNLDEAMVGMAVLVR